MNRRTTVIDPDQTLDRLESEVSNIATAIAFVASGAATRVTVSGLRFGDRLIARFRAEAAAQRITLDPLYWPDDAGCDVLVRRDEHD